MQIVPATGRRYARALKIPRFSARRLTDPEVNVRIGTAYFADLVERFGGVHHALASYNAGPSPVSRWIAEKPGVVARRVHRRHPVSRDAELREAHPRHRRRLPPPLQRAAAGAWCPARPGTTTLAATQEEGHGADPEVSRRG